jgi:hypothetical protein
MKRKILVLLGTLLVAGTVLALVSAAQSSPQSTEEPEPVLEDFEPSEDLPADSAISLPVDI